MQNNIKEVLNLIKKTGDNCIIVNSGGNPEYVVLPFNVYSKMIENNAKIIELSEDELLEKINRDIAIWKTSQQENEPSSLDDFLAKESQKIDSKEDFFEEEEEKYYFEPIE